MLAHSLVLQQEVPTKPPSNVFYHLFVAFIMGGMDWADKANREQLLGMAVPDTSNNS